MSLTAMSLSTWITLFSALGGVVTLLYLLRLRRRQVEVPFGPLWQQVLNETQSSSLFRALKRILSWLLQLLFLALILLAISDPIWTGKSVVSEAPSAPKTEPKHTLVIIDTSASMQATDIPEGRFEAAQKAALRVIDARVADEAMMLVTAARDVETVTGWTTDTSALRRAVTQLRPTDTATHPEAWTAYARNVVRGLEQARVVLITDRGFLPIEQDVVKSIGLQVIDVAPASPEGAIGNVAIADFIVRSHLGNSLKYAMYYRLKNYSPKTVEVTTYLHIDADNIAKTASDFRALPPSGKPMVHLLEPGEEKTFERTDIAMNGRRAALMIEVDGIEDILSADNVAYSVIPQRKTVRVALVGPPQMFVEAALRARTHVEVVQIPLADWKSAEGFDVAVFNGVAPKEIPMGNSIWLSVSSGSPARVKGDTRGGELIVPSSQATHPAMRYVRFVDLEPKRLLRFKPRRNDIVLARTKKGARPAVIAHSEPETRWLAVGFDPVDSEWVTHYSFSVFFVNAINWFFQEESRFEKTLTLARRWNVTVPWANTKRVSVSLPTGSEEAAIVDDGGRMAYTGQSAGVYEIRSVDYPDLPAHTVAASLANPIESELGASGDYEPYRQHTAPEISIDNTPTLLGAPLWQLFVLLALALTTLEWFTYNRRWTV